MEDAKYAILRYIKGNGGGAYRNELLRMLPYPYSQITEAIADLKKSGVLYSVPDMRHPQLGTYYQTDKE